MDFIDPKELKPKAARQLALDLQVRMLKLENTLDDLMRSVEIAQYTKQYQVTEVFVREAEELLKDRLVLPKIEQGDQKFTLINGEISDETKAKIGAAQRGKPKAEGRKVSEEGLLKIRENIESGRSHMHWLGRKHTEDAKEKMSKTVFVMPDGI